jgi:hypothetical protein
MQFPICRRVETECDPRRRGGLLDDRHFDLLEGFHLPIIVPFFPFFVDRCLTCM